MRLSTGPIAVRLLSGFNPGKAALRSSDLVRDLGIRRTALFTIWSMRLSPDPLR
jgi:hypothetical protein